MSTNPSGLLNFLTFAVEQLRQYVIEYEVKTSFIEIDDPRATLYQRVHSDIAADLRSLELALAHTSLAQAQSGSQLTDADLVDLKKEYLRLFNLFNTYTDWADNLLAVLRLAADIPKEGDATNMDASGLANVEAVAAGTDLVVDDSVRAGATIVEAPRTRRIRGLDTSSEEAEKQPVASNSLVSNGGDGDGGGATAVKPKRTRRTGGLDTSSEEAEKAPKRGRVKIRGLDSSSENGVGEKPAGSLRRRPPRRAAGERAMCGPEEAKEYQPVVKGMGKAKDTDQDKDLGKDEDKAKDPSKDTDLDRFLNSRSPR